MVSKSSTNYTPNLGGSRLLYWVLPTLRQAALDTNRIPAARVASEIDRYSAEELAKDANCQVKGADCLVIALPRALVDQGRAQWNLRPSREKRTCRSPPAPRLF